MLCVACVLCSSSSLYAFVVCCGLLVVHCSLFVVSCSWFASCLSFRCLLRVVVCCGTFATCVFFGRCVLRGGYCVLFAFVV